MTQKKEKPNIEELQEHSYRYHRLMGKLGITGIVETHFEDACKEIGRLQGFEEGVKSAKEIIG